MGTVSGLGSAPLTRVRPLWSLDGEFRLRDFTFFFRIVCEKNCSSRSIKPSKAREPFRLGPEVARPALVVDSQEDFANRSGG
jgi:hypothetical protein